MKVTMLTVGVVLAVISAGLLGVVVLNVASLEPYVGSGGVRGGRHRAGGSRRDDRHRPGTLGASQASANRHRTPERRPAGLGVR